MIKKGLYDPIFEHENCGAGFICSLNGIKSNDIINKALNILTRLEHRGAVSSDGRTGDGAGILIDIPHDFFKKVCEFKIPNEGDYAVGMVFLPQRAQQNKICRQAFENEIEKQNLEILGWRDVPVDSRVVGRVASTCQPVIKQVFIKKIDDANLSRAKLYTARKIAENKIYKSELSQKQYFYFSSLIPNPTVAVHDHYFVRPTSSLAYGCGVQGTSPLSPVQGDSCDHYNQYRLLL